MGSWVYKSLGSAVALAMVSISVPAVGQGAASRSTIEGPVRGNEDVTKLIAEWGLRTSNETAKSLIKDWKPRKIVVRVDNRADRLAWLQEVAPGVQLVPVKSTEEALKQAVDADGLVNMCDAKVIAAAKKLRWIQVMQVGAEHCIPSLNGRTDIVLSNLQRVYGNVLSDHAMAMLLTLTRGLDIYARQNATAHFDRTKVPAGRLWELRDRTILIVGLGGIGTDVASKAHAFGMHVIATRNSSREGPDFVEYVGLANELPALIGKADVVLMAAPLTKETTNLFDAAMFARMKKGAIFINIARGGSVVQDDLITALKSGQVGAAGLDVTVPEPLTDNHPLFSAPNTLITPHMAGAAVGSGPGSEEGWQVVRENLRRYVAGDKLYNVVNIARGY